MGGGQGLHGRHVRGGAEPAQRVLRAIDIQTGKVAWELPQFGTSIRGAACSATASDVVFFGDDSGAFAAADAKTGQAAVEFPDQPGVEVVADDLRRSTTGSMVAVASGPSILAFGLPTR